MIDIDVGVELSLELASKNKNGLQTGHTLTHFRLPHFLPSVWQQQVFHKTGCFKCTHCAKNLSPGNYAGMGGVYYCKVRMMLSFQPHSCVKRYQYLDFGLVANFTWVNNPFRGLSSGSREQRGILRLPARSVAPVTLFSPLLISIWLLRLV